MIGPSAPGIGALGILPWLAVVSLVAQSPPPAAELQALLVSPGWHTEPVAVEEIGGLDAHPGASALWTWSPESPPVRSPLPLRGPVRRELPAEWLEVEIAPRPRPAGVTELTVLAAPVEMWQEVPESLIPSWPVPRDGHLRLPRSPGETWRLRAAGGGFGTEWIEAAPGDRRVRLAVRPAEDRELRIADPAGEPVAGLAVQAFVEGDPSDRGRVAVYRSDLSGTLRLPGLPSDVEIELLAIGEDHAPLHFSGRVADLPARLRVEAGGIVAGRLVDDAGRPVAEAAVTLLAFSAPGSAKVVSRGTRSDGGGAWTIGGVAAGPAQLSVTAEGFARLTRTVEIEPDEATAVGKMTLSPGRSVLVRVVDAEGSGIAGAELLTRAGHRAVADAHGRALVEALPPAGAVEATVSAAGFLPRTVRLDPAPAEGIEVVLIRAAIFTGRLLDAEGAPVAAGRATVEIHARSEHRELEPDGRFTLELPPRAPAQLELTSPATVAVRIALAPSDAGARVDLGDLRAPAGWTVSGRLVRSDDATPVPGARVWTLRSNHDPLHAWAQGDLLEARSDADGRFRLRGLPPAAALLRIDGPGLARRHLEVAAPADETHHELGDVALEPGSTVTVETAEDPEPGLIARLDLRSTWLESDMLTATMSGGRAVFTGVPAGRATLSLVRGHEMQCDREIDVPEGGEELTVDCERDRGRVRGTVTAGDLPAGPGLLVWSLDGERAPGVILDRRVGELTSSRVLWGGRPDVRVEVDAGGWFETTALGAGRWQVAWAPEGGVQHARRLGVELADAGEQEIALRFPLLALHGTVVDGDRRGVAGARVAELSQGAFALSAADGSFQLEGLEPGRLRVHARHGDTSSEVATVELAAGDTPEPIELELAERQRPLTVEVVDANGSPVAGALVFLEQEGGAVRLVTTGLDGRVSLPFDPPLPRTVRAAAFAGGEWSLGDSVGYEPALESLPLQLEATGGLEITCEDACGPLALRSAGGWDLAMLHLRLGLRLATSPEQPLTIRGLPPGRYAAGSGGASVEVSVDEGPSRDLRLP